MSSNNRARKLVLICKVRICWP